MKELVLRDIRLLLRERTFASILFFLIFTASFASLVTYGLVFLSSPQSVHFTSLNVGVVGDCPILKSVIGGRSYDNLEDALSDFSAGVIDAIVYLPKENVSGTNYVTVYLPKDELVTFVAASFLKDKLEIYEAKLREARGINVVKLVVFSEKQVSYYKGFSTAFKFIYVALIPLLVLTTAIVSSGVLIDSTTEEFETGSVEVLMSAPISMKKLLAYKLLSSGIISLSLTAFWILLLRVNSIEVHNLPIFFLSAASVYFIFNSIALLTSAHFKDRERSQLFFSFIATGIVALSFLSKYSVAGILTRVSAGSPFSILEVVLYATLSAMMVFASLEYGSRKIVLS